MMANTEHRSVRCNLVPGSGPRRDACMEMCQHRARPTPKMASRRVMPRSLSDLWYSLGALRAGSLRSFLNSKRGGGCDTGRVSVASLSGAATRNVAHATPGEEWPLSNHAAQKQMVCYRPHPAIQMCRKAAPGGVTIVKSIRRRIARVFTKPARCDPSFVPHF